MRLNESNQERRFRLISAWAGRRIYIEYMTKELDDIFDSVIKANDWEETDAILAVGDDGDIVYRPLK